MTKLLRGKIMSTNQPICISCKRREAFFFRPYSGEKLCRKCFIESIERKVRATIAKYNMFNFDDKIAVAVSGGKDSISLLNILAKIEKHFSKASLVVITIDEGIQGYRNEARKIAIEKCEKLKLPFYIVSFKELYGFTLDNLVKRMKEKSDVKLTPCAYCGVLRRKALNIAARKVKADKIATGHTLDDEVQTILLNIFHGDVHRIAREKPVTDEAHPKLVQKVKPFCELPEREVALYAYLKKMTIQSRVCPYASEALRNDARIMLNRMEEKHAGIKFTIFKSIERLRPCLEGLAIRKVLRLCNECGEPTTSNICRACQILRQVN